VLYSALQGDSIETDKRWVSLLTQQIKVAEIELSAELGYANANIGELMALQAGDFIELELPEKIVVKSDGVPIFDCRYGVSNGHYAVRVQDILSTPQAQ
jgi:flagellar motor switch protein FliM